LSEAREVAVVTLVGRLFHARAAVTRKDWSTMVRSRVLGTIRHCWEPDRSRRSDSHFVSPLMLYGLGTLTSFCDHSEPGFRITVWVYERDIKHSANCP